MIIKDSYGIENLGFFLMLFLDLSIELLRFHDDISVKFESLCVETVILLIAKGTVVAYNREPTVTTFILPIKTIFHRISFN
jgi:hypothetical protein